MKKALIILVIIFIAFPLMSQSRDKANNMIEFLANKVSESVNGYISMPGKISDTGHSYCVKVKAPSYYDFELLATVIRRDIIMNYSDLTVTNNWKLMDNGLISLFFTIDSYNELFALSWDSEKLEVYVITLYTE